MTNKKREKLVIALQNLPEYMINRLDELKEGSKLIEREDFICHFLLQSFATMGRARGHEGLILNKNNYDRVTYEAVINLNPSERLKILNTVMKNADIRYPEKKAAWLNYNYEFISKLGGPLKVKLELFSQNGREGKIAYLKRFRGIGDKYARNIFMDVYHPEFHDSIAIDLRIKEVTEALGYSFDSYEAHEKFYLDIAKEASLNGWELDRLLFNFKGYFIKIMA